MKKLIIVIFALLLSLTAFASTGSHSYKKGLTGYVGLNNNYIGHSNYNPNDIMGLVGKLAYKFNNNIVLFGKTTANVSTGLAPDHQYWVFSASGLTFTNINKGYQTFSEIVGGGIGYSTNTLAYGLGVNYINWNFGGTNFNNIWQGTVNNKIYTHIFHIAYGVGLNPYIKYTQGKSTYNANLDYRYLTNSNLNINNKFEKPVQKAVFVSFKPGYSYKVTKKFTVGTKGIWQLATPLYTNYYNIKVNSTVDNYNNLVNSENRLGISGNLNYAFFKGLNFGLSVDANWMNYNKGYQNRLSIVSHVTSTFYTMFAVTPSLTYRLNMANGFMFETGVLLTAYNLYGKKVTTKTLFNGSTTLELGYAF